MSTNTEPIVLGAGDTVARRAIVEAISWAGAASAALDIDHRPEEAALVDEAIDALTRAYEAAGAPRPGEHIMNKKRIHQQQSRRKQICSERLQVPKPQPEVSDEELDRRALESLEGKPMTKGAGQ